MNDDLEKAGLEGVSNSLGAVFAALGGGLVAWLTAVKAVVKAAWK